MKRIAVISAILERPTQTQQQFNDTVANFKGIVRGRMGIPFAEEDLSIVSITVVGDVDDINALTGKLGNLPHITVKTAISKQEARG